MTVTPENGKHARAVQEELTARLPRWFGNKAANRHYAEQAETLPAYVARVEGRDVGLLLLKHHSPHSAEIYWMAVDPDHHRRGIGNALLAAACVAARREGCRMLFVLTLGPDSANEDYRQTRLFYEAEGFTLALSGHGVEAPLAYYVKLLDA